MEADNTHILIIDDHQLIIDGLASVIQTLSPSIRISHSNDANQALEWLMNECDYDLILLDINMPNMDGFSFMKAMNEHTIPIPVAIISATENVNDVYKVLQAGALGFISKADKSDELLDAIKCILSGNVYTPSWYKNIKTQNDDAKTVTARQIGISRRQLDVLELMMSGQTNKKIADILFISEATVKSHVSALFEIFSAKNRTDCINAARRRGLNSNDE